MFELCVLTFIVLGSLWRARTRSDKFVVRTQGRDTVPMSRADAEHYAGAFGGEVRRLK